jgi:cytochrome c peroxidase
MRTADGGGDLMGAPSDGGAFGAIRDAGAQAVGTVADAGAQAAGAAKDAGARAAGAVAGAAAKAGTAGADVAEALSRLAPAPPIPETPVFLPAVEEPKDNPTTPDKVALGYQLFFDRRLSRDGSMSCESCHHPDQAYTSGKATDEKVGGAQNTRNAPTMENVGYNAHGFYWDGRSPTMESVSAAAWQGQLGVANPDEVAARLNAITVYRAEFQRAFKEDATAKNIPLALAAFLRALKTGNAPWDKFEQGDAKAVSREAQRGYRVFQNARCTLCHVPPLYTDTDFHNVGVGYSPGTGFKDHGRMDATKDPKDDGKFKTPTLRDVAKTAPYFHDGSVASLGEAIDYMLRGGTKNPNLDVKLKPARLGARDRKALQAFLESLTGQNTFPKAPELP